METLRKEVEQLRLVVTRELCGLRRDVDILQHGGWEVKIGAFQAMHEPDKVGVRNLEERMLDLKAGDVSAVEKVVDNNTNGLEEHPKPAVNGSSSTTGDQAKGTTQSRTDQRPVVPVVEERPRPVVQLKPTLFKKFPSPDEAVPSIEDPAVTARFSFKPLIISQLSPLMPEIATGVPSAAATRTFSVEFIHDLLGGSQWSPGFYYIPPSSGSCVLSSRSYYCLDASVDPFLPSAPGAHGAKLIPFVHDSTAADDPEDNNTRDVPVFIQASTFATLAGKPSHEYVYFGNYSQLRFSDRLDYDHMVKVISNEVKMYWAEQLSDPGRPDWVTEALMGHFEQKPQFSGDLTDSHIGEYLQAMKQWQQEASEKVNELKKEDVLKAFESADCDDPPGLRLWWEYLQCVGYDGEFYKALVKKQEAWKKR